MAETENVITTAEHTQAASVVERTPPGFMSQREAEMQAGRERVLQNMAASDLARRQADQMVRNADEQIKEDEEQRRRVLDTSVTVDKREHDQAGAEVADQAQTMLEAVQQLADRNEPIIDFRRSNRVGRLEDETVDTEAARQLTVDHVTAQAVNQPTVLASERGVETENRPLNLPESGFSDEELALSSLATPKDKHVPKTRAMAEEISQQKVPEPERVVKEAAIVSDHALHRNEAIDIVREAPDQALSIDGTPETDPRSTTNPSAFVNPTDVQSEHTQARAANPRAKARSQGKGK